MKPMVPIAAALLGCFACQSTPDGSSAAPRPSAQPQTTAKAQTKAKPRPTSSASARVAAAPAPSAKPAQAPGWRSGSKVSVVLRAHRLDQGEGACAAKEKVGEHRCFLRGRDDAWPKGPPAYERTFVPVSVVYPEASRRQNLLSIGFWQDPVVRQRSRACIKPFLVRCTFEVWKQAPNDALLRWRKKESWFAAGKPAHSEAAYLGKVSDCKAASAKESPRPAMYCSD